MQRITRIYALAGIGLALAAAQAVEGFMYLGDARYLSLLLFMAAVVGVLACLKMTRDNCFESRFGLAVIAMSTVVGHALSRAAGLPGSAADPWSGSHGVLSVISLAVALVMLLLLLPRFFSSYGGGSRPPV